MTPAQFYQKQFLREGRMKKKIYASDNWRFFEGVLFQTSSSGVTYGQMNAATIPTEEEIALHQINFAKKAFAPNAVAKQFLNQFSNGKIDLASITNVFSGTNLNLQDILDKIDEVFKFSSSYSYVKNSKNNGTRNSHASGLSLLTGKPVNFSQNVPAYQSLQQAFSGLLGLLHNVLNSSQGAIINNQDIQTQMTKLDQALNELNSALNAYNITGQAPTNMTSFNYRQLEWAVNQLKGAFLEDNALDFINAVVPSIFLGQDVRAINSSKITTQTGNLIHKIGGGADGIFIDMGNPDLFKTNLPFSYTKGGKPGTAKTIGDFLNEVDKTNGTTAQIVIDNPSAYFDMIQKYGNGLNIKSGRKQSLVNKERSKISINQLPDLKYTRILKLLIDWYSFGHIYSSNKNYNLFFDYNLIHFMTSMLGKGNSLVVTRDGIMSLSAYLEQEWNSRHAYIKAREAIRLSAGPDKQYQVGAVTSAKINTSH